MTKKHTLSITLIMAVMTGCGTGRNSEKDRNSGDASGTAAEVAANDGRTAFTDNPILTLAEVPELAGQAQTIRPELAALFCIHVYKLPHKADFSQEFAVLCDENGKPSATMADLDRYSKVAASTPRSVQLALEQGPEFTSGIFAAVYDIPIAPKWGRQGSIQAYMMQPSRFSYVTLDGIVSQDMNDALGGDLQFSRYGLNYKTDIQTPDNQPFKNERNTEFNAYQVHGGNPDIGIGTEHLTDTGNADFPYFHTITVTIGSQSGGSVLITIIKGSVRHNGYTDLAARVFSDTATAQATNVRGGLLSELAGYIIK
jgi:hypothetical protein